MCARERGLRDLHKIGTQKDPLLVTHLLLRDPDCKPVAVRLNNDAARALKVLAAREGTTFGHLLIDAINGIFAAHGEPATEHGITGWTKGEAMDAAREAFDCWRYRAARQAQKPRAFLSPQKLSAGSTSSAFKPAANCR